MPQTQYKLGSSLGEALSGAFNNHAFDRGQMDGATLAMHQANAAKSLADSQLSKRQLELQNPDNVLTAALQSAGINDSERPKFDNYMKYGTLEAPQPPALPDSNSILSGILKSSMPRPAPFSAEIMPNLEPRQVSMPTTINPAVKQRYDMAMRHIASLNQAFAQGDKDTTHATETMLANLRASGAGNDNTTRAQLLLHGKPQFDALANNVTDVVHGTQALNAYGNSQVRENNAQAVNAIAQTGKRSATVQIEKPMPVQAMKLQEENIDAIATARGIKTDLSSFLNQLDSGALNLGVLSNAMSSAKNFTGNSDEQSRNYQSFNATLEKLRNDSLRLNKGVQTDGDAQRAWNELLTNINDPKVVRQRLVEIQAINDRAVKIRMARNNNLRKNYGAPAMDYSPYLNQESAISGSTQQQEQVQQPEVVRTGMVNGRKVVQLSDGSIQFAE